MGEGAMGWGIDGVTASIHFVSPKNNPDANRGGEFASSHDT
jgi:hypothetical protein